MLLCQVTEVMFTSGLTALVSYTIVYLRGSSMVLLSALFSECKHSSQDIFQELCNAENGRDILSFLLISAGFMMLMTIITFGNPAPGGVFVPTLVTGALMGRAVGFAMQLLENEMGDVGIFETCVSAEHCITPGWLASRLIHHPIPLPLPHLPTGSSFSYPVNFDGYSIAFCTGM